MIGHPEDIPEDKRTDDFATLSEGSLKNVVAISCPKRNGKISVETKNRNLPTYRLNIRKRLINILKINQIIIFGSKTMNCKNR